MNILKPFIFTIITLTSFLSYGQTIPSVPFTGAPGTGAVPDGWSMVGLSPDLESLPTVPIWGWGIDPESLVGLPPGLDRICHTHCLDHYDPSILKGESLGIEITGLTPGETYTFTTWTAGTCYYSPDPTPGDVHTSVWVGETVADIEALGDSPTLIGRDVSLSHDWEEESWTFTATAASMWIALGPSSESYRDYSHTGVLWAIEDPELVVDDPCTDLTTTVSETELCAGETVTLEAVSETGGTVTWDGGVVDGEAFEPPVGTTTYTATSDSDLDCEFSVDITVHELPDVTATASDDVICLGEDVSVSGGGATSYVWDPDVDDGVDFTPDEVGTTTYTVTGTDDNGCENTASVDITVAPAPAAAIEFIVSGLSSEDGGTGGCIASEVQFNDLSTIADPESIVNWDWDFGDGSGSSDENPTHTYDAPGTYTVTLTVESENGCTSTIDIEIVMTEGLTLELLSNNPTCFGFSDGSVTVNVFGGTGELIFTITDEDGNVVNEDNSNTANTLPEGWYYITVEDDSECAGEASIFLDDPDEMEVDLTIVDPACYGEASGWAMVDSVHNATGLYSEISYFWAPNTFGDEGVGVDSAWALTEGDYTLTINDENGCSKVVDFTVNQPDSLFLTEFGVEPAHCRLFDYQSGNGVVYGGAAGGTPSYTYIWTDLTTGDTQENTTWGGLNPGDYELTVTDDNGCTLIRTIKLDSINPIADFNVISEQLNEDLQGTAPVEVEFENTSINFYNENDPFGDTTFFWALDDPTSGWEVTHDYFYRPDTTYGPNGQSYNVSVCLVAINKNGCSDTLCKELTIYEAFDLVDVNIFTPNNDGANDIFTFEFQSASIAEFNCVIVNRWGVVMAELNDITDGWDGTDPSGSPAADGTYFYVYTAITDNNNKLEGQGTINLAR